VEAISTTPANPLASRFIEFHQLPMLASPAMTQGRTLILLDTYIGRTIRNLERIGKTRFFGKVRLPRFPEIWVH
jgi:hypothetical protein